MVGRTGAERARTIERTGGRGPRGADRQMGGRGADGAHEAQTGGQAVRRTGRLGGQGRKSRDRADWTDRRTCSRVVGRTGGRAEEGVGLGLKGHIPQGPFHSWAPSLLASSERECIGCLGM